MPVSRLQQSKKNYNQIVILYESLNKNAGLSYQSMNSMPDGVWLWKQKQATKPLLLVCLFDFTHNAYLIFLVL